ncbi:efflux RND transporter periplasmic adaptor subunit [Asticcacaulis sp. BYS171W]|uniref:Efflux RND transporter periplasmic adaptor subunit n=1 Tax=Asticcacaulis aquaticus TaxID=2984212 RepID=A0ABT5HUY6_9CAUL|nr:efflux RND transporter periplasmic adaptor subunit [Asticcacaulis aquaticus]MDC7683892.1 efflux RND transporter periplasmic adaptor subunit [Asticcacaulis aquaticus]
MRAAFPATTNLISYRTVLRISAIATFALLAACSGGKKEKKDADKGAAHHSALVEVAVAGEIRAPGLITGSGSIGAWQEAPIGAEVGGLTATAVLVDEGQYVKQGQPLLKMNDAGLRAQYSQAEAGVSSAKAQAVEAQRAYQRYKELFDKGYASQAALDQKEAAHKTALAQVATAEASRTEVGTRLNQTVVRAPVSGLITSRTAVAGQIVSPGVELFRIVRDNRIELNMEVVETELNLIKPGMSATVTNDMGDTVSGTVRVVTPAINAETRLGYARIAIPATAGFKPGQFGRGSINVGDRNVVSIPQKAVVYKDNRSGVFVIDTKNKAVFRAVTLGPVTGDTVVLRDGVTPGEKVVTTGAGFLNDGDTVTVGKAPAVKPAGSEAK